MEFLLFILLVVMIVCKLKSPRNNNNYRKSHNSNSHSKPITKEHRKTYINDNGYACFVNSNKLVHRWVMEKAIGRRLGYGEVIHHINGDKLNNRIENLKLFSSQIEHEQYHQEHLKNYGSWYEEIPEYSQRTFYNHNQAKY